MPPEQPLNAESRLVSIEGKLDQLLLADQKRRRFTMWIFIISAALIILPLLFLPFAIQSFLSTLTLPAGF